MITVGTVKKKQVSELNNELFKHAVAIFDNEHDYVNGPDKWDEYSVYHWGLVEMGKFIDWLEIHYTITEKKVNENTK